MKAIFKPMKGLLAVATFLAFWGVFPMGTPKICHAYIMPAEQIIGLMMENFKGFREVTLVQGVRCDRADIEKKSEARFRQRLFLKSPGRYALKTLESSGKPGESEGGSLANPVNDVVYRPLLMSNSAYFIMSLLAEMGVDLGAVRLTRAHGLIAYRIGDKEGSSILIEKDHFLPLDVTYCRAGLNGPEAVTVQFRDYRNAGGEALYPHAIIYQYGTHQTEHITLISLDHQTRIATSLVQIKTRDLLSARACGDAFRRPQEPRETQPRQTFKIHQRTSE